MEIAESAAKAKSNIEDNGDGTEYLLRTFGRGSVAVLGDFARDYARRLHRAGFVPYVVDYSGSFNGYSFMVACGNVAVNECKRISKATKLPFYAIIDRPYFCVYDNLYSYKINGATLYKSGNAPFCAAVIPEYLQNDGLPAAFGEICSAVLNIFDTAVCGIIGGEYYNAEILSKAADVISSAVELATEFRRDDSRLTHKLACVSVKLSKLSQSHKKSFFHGAAEDCARAAAILFNYEQRKPLKKGEFSFLFACILSKIYGAFLSSDNFFLPPPDNNLRAELLEEYFGFNKLTAARSAVSRIQNARLCAYKIGEYKEELYSILLDASKILDEARKPFKRLYSDDGYFLKGLLDTADVKLITALAPDTFSFNVTALTVMRDLGYLDRFLQFN